MVSADLSRHGLDALLRMGMTSGASPAVFDEDVLERSFDLRCLAAEILRVDDWDRALMAPKLSAKSRAMAIDACSDARFMARVIAAQMARDVAAGRSCRGAVQRRDAALLGVLRTVGADLSSVDGVRGVGARTACHVGDVRRTGLCTSGRNCVDVSDDLQHPTGS